MIHLAPSRFQACIRALVRALWVLLVSLALVACGTAAPSEPVPDPPAAEQPTEPPADPTDPAAPDLGPDPWEPLPCCSEVCFTLEDGTVFCIPIVWID